MVFAKRVARIVLLLLLASGVIAQQERPTPKPSLSQMIPETMRFVLEDDYQGFVWWVPPELWEVSGMEGRQVKELSKYTLMIVVIGRKSAFGANVDYLSPSELRSNMVLQDAEGTNYPPLPTVSKDIETFVAALRVFLHDPAMQEHADFVFFAGMDKAGKPLASARKRGGLRLIIRKVAGEEERLFDWQTPLDSFSPPVYCPVGKERLQASWRYCPWHGVKLYDDSNEKKEK